MPRIFRIFVREIEKVVHAAKANVLEGDYTRAHADFSACAQSAVSGGKFRPNPQTRRPGVRRKRRSGHIPAAGAGAGIPAADDGIGPPAAARTNFGGKDCGNFIRRRQKALRRPENGPGRPGIGTKKNADGGNLLIRRFPGPRLHRWRKRGTENG